MKHSDVKVSFNYAWAWFSMASDMSSEDEVYNDCLLWKNILQFEPVINVIFGSPICRAEKKNDLFNGFSAGNISELSKSVFYLLNKNKRAGLWQKVIDCFIKIYLKNKNIVAANVVTSFPINQETSKKMQEVVKYVFDCNDVMLQNIVDEKILGGFVLVSNTGRYDRSLKSMFENLKKKLVNI